MVVAYTHTGTLAVSTWYETCLYVTINVTITKIVTSEVTIFVSVINKGITKQAPECAK